MAPLMRGASAVPLPLTRPAGAVRLDQSLKSRLLSKLSIEAVLNLLCALELDRYESSFAHQGISGADLDLADEADLEELGMGVALHRRRFLSQLQTFREQGVPPDLHTELPQTNPERISGPWFYVADGLAKEPTGRSATRCR